MTIKAVIYKVATYKAAVEFLEHGNRKQQSIMKRLAVIEKNLHELNKEKTRILEQGITGLIWISENLKNASEDSKQ